MVMPSLERWPTKAKEAPSPHEVRLTPLDTNPVFQCLGEAQFSFAAYCWISHLVTCCIEQNGRVFMTISFDMGKERDNYNLYPKKKQLVRGTNLVELS